MTTEKKTYQQSTCNRVATHEGIVSVCSNAFNGDSHILTLLWRVKCFHFSNAVICEDYDISAQPTVMLYVFGSEALLLVTIWSWSIKNAFILRFNANHICFHWWWWWWWWFCGQWHFVVAYICLRLEPRYGRFQTSMIRFCFTTMERCCSMETLCMLRLRRCAIMARTKV